MPARRARLLGQARRMPYRNAAAQRRSLQERAAPASCKQFVPISVKCLMHSSAAKRSMDALPDVLVAAVLGLLPLDDRLRCCVLSHRFARLVREAAHTRSLSFGGVARARRCAVDGAALGALCGRAAATLAAVDLSELPPRGALSPADAVAALQRCAPPGVLREARAWHAGASDAAQYDTAAALCDAAGRARTPAPLVALLRGHVSSAQAVISFAYGLADVLRAAQAADEAAGVHNLEAGAEAADIAADAGAAAALLAGLAAHPDNGPAAYSCLAALTALARVTPEHVAPGAPRAAAAAAALRWLLHWEEDDDIATALRALTVFAKLPAPEAVDAAVAAMQHAWPSAVVCHAAMLLISEQRAGAAAHAAEAPALAAALRCAEESPEMQNRMLSLVVLQELLQARRPRKLPPPPPHPQAARLLAAAVAALRPRPGDAADARCIYLLSGAQELLHWLLAHEGVTCAAACAAGALPAAIAALHSIGEVTDAASADVWSRIVSLLCQLVCADEAACSERAAMAVAGGVHEAARAAAAARPSNARLQRAACLAIYTLADAVSEHDIIRPDGLLQTAIAVQYSTRGRGANGEEDEVGGESTASAAVTRLAERSEVCKARLYELLGLRMGYAEGGPRDRWERLRLVATVPAMVLPPPPPPRDCRVTDALATALGGVPLSVQLHMARAGAAASLRRCVATVQGPQDTSASAPPQRARRTEASAACAAVLALAAHVEAGRRLEAAVKDEDGQDGEDDPLLVAAKQATVTGAAMSRKEDSCAAWSTAHVMVALLSKLAIVEASQSEEGRK
jgi:hypothetical protein